MTATARHTVEARPPKQCVIERYIRAARKAGVEIGGVEITPDGTVRILTPAQTASHDPLAEWRKRRGHHAA